MLDRYSILVWLRDLSVEGIGLVHSQALEDGDEFIAEFPLRNQQNLNVLYRVVHCKMLSKNLYCIGARLVRMLERRDFRVPPLVAPPFLPPLLPETRGQDLRALPTARV